MIYGPLVQEQETSALKAEQRRCNHGRGYQFMKKALYYLCFIPGGLIVFTCAVVSRLLEEIASVFLRFERWCNN